MIGTKRGFRTTVLIVMVLMAIICLFPFLVMIVSSFTAEDALIRNGYSAFTTHLSTMAYEYLFKTPMMIIKAYGVTIFVTVIGTALGLSISMMLAYGLSIRNLPLRNVISFFLFFTMLFNGGTVPTYIMWTQVFHVKNTMAALIFPRLLVFAMYVIIMRSYFQSNIPEEMREAARIDGASEFKIFSTVVLPLAKPITASVGLMIGISYWNDWMNGLYYVTDSNLYSVQQILNRMLADARFLVTNSSGIESMGNAFVPNNGLKMAIAAVGAIPIMLLLPFFQKYYVKGLTLGAVKG